MRSFRHLGRRVAAIVLSIFLVCLCGAETLGAEPFQPQHWPSSVGLSPEIEGWPNLVRFSGPDRYQTSLAGALGVRGDGHFPFSRPSARSSYPNGLSTQSNWWGSGRCPRAVIVVAGDAPADALAAASLSDPTGFSHEPYLQRMAAADPLFDPVGGFKKVDTDYAPVILTKSTRQGATSLSLSSRFAMQDLRNGGCKTAREAIIVGGTAAVPKTVESEIISIGYDSVYRVSGENRFATAGAVARALGTAVLPEGIDSCVDVSVDDGSAEMNYYVNSAVEWRSSPKSCELLEQTVVLVDGVTGADALAAGWWTSFWQVPVLLHDGSKSLPVATRQALQTIQVSNLLVIGGNSRISETVLNEAENISGAKVRRVAGQDRYETSVQMARNFGGWWPSTPGSGASASTVCIVASSGVGARSKGWPDALGAGPWCAATSWATSQTGPPQRLLSPVNGAEPLITDENQIPDRQSIPVLLVPYGASELPRTTRDFLTEMFVPNVQWCSSAVSSNSCSMPGFSVAFGGENALNSELLSEVSGLLAGVGRNSDNFSSPTIGDVFLTNLELGPIYDRAGVGETNVCFPRGSYEGARWLLLGAEKYVAPTVVFDAAVSLWYQGEAEGMALATGIGRPGCLKVETAGPEDVWVQVVDISGRSSTKVKISRVDIGKFVLSSALVVQSPSFVSGEPSYFDGAAGKTSLTFGSTSNSAVTATISGETASIRNSSVTVHILRQMGATQNIDLFESSWRIETVHGEVIGQASGEARLINNRWHLSGKSSVTGGDWTSRRGNGGFHASIDINGSDSADDVISWRVDGQLSG